ncbi:MAG: hypothetical protein M9932_07560 [Xanthobacteraceae bacterium]|nr:hypothetical protein [Xanthobacteraceae bacterium]
MDLQSNAVRRVTRVLAWLCLAYIAFVTVGPIDFRPETGYSPRLERLVAFMVMGGLFAAAYPRHIVLAGLVVIGSALLLEAFQVFEPSRHGRLFDSAVKIIGGLIGLGAGWLLARLTRR